MTAADSPDPCGSLGPLDAWLRGGPCPTWCRHAHDPAGHPYDMDGDGSYLRTHIRDLIDPAALGLGVLVLDQAETTPDPDQASSFDSAGLYCASRRSSDVETTGTLPQLAAGLRRLAARLLDAADELDRIHLDPPPDNPQEPATGQDPRR